MTRYALPAAIIILELVCQAFPVLHSLLRYQQDMLPNQAWRYLTANFLHTNFTHLAMNSLALLLIYDIFQFYQSPKRFTLVFISICIINTLLLAFFSQIHWYVGLSGVLHGLMFYGAYQLLGKHKQLGLLLMVGVAGKVGYEYFEGPSSLSAKLIGARVVYEAHLTGILAAIFIIVCFVTIEFFSNRKDFR